MAKVQTSKENGNGYLKKFILQFELLNTYHSNSSCKMSYTPKSS